MSSSYNNHFAFGMLPVLRSHVQYKNQNMSLKSQYSNCRGHLRKLYSWHTCGMYNSSCITINNCSGNLWKSCFPAIHKFGLPVYPPPACLSGQLPASHLALPSDQMASHLLKIIDGAVHPRSQCLYLAIFRNDVSWTRSWKINLWWPLWVNKNISWSPLRTKYLSWPDTRIKDRQTGIVASLEKKKVNLFLSMSRRCTGEQRFSPTPFEARDWVVTFTSYPLFPQERTTMFTEEEAGLDSRSGRFGEKSLSPAEIWTPHLSAASLHLLRMYPYSHQTLDLKVPKTNIITA